MGENGTNGSAKVGPILPGVVVKGCTANGHPVPDAGGAMTTFNPADAKDQAMLRRMLARDTKRWSKLTPGKREYIVGGLLWAMRKGRKYEPSGEHDHELDGARLVVSAAKTLAGIEAQNQADEHQAEKYDRLDNGKPTEGIDHRLVHYVNAPEGEL